MVAGSYREELSIPVTPPCMEYPVQSPRSQSNDKTRLPNASDSSTTTSSSTSAPFSTTHCQYTQCFFSRFEFLVFANTAVYLSQSRLEKDDKMPKMPYSSGVSAADILQLAGDLRFQPNGELDLDSLASIAPTLGMSPADIAQSVSRVDIVNTIDENGVETRREFYSAPTTQT